jgi:hypothetical protein
MTHAGFVHFSVASLTSGLFCAVNKKTFQKNFLENLSCGDPNGRRGEEKIRNREQINPGAIV